MIKEILRETDLVDLDLTGGILKEFTPEKKSFLVINYTRGDESGISIFPKYKANAYGTTFRFTGEVPVEMDWAFFCTLNQGTTMFNISSVQMSATNVFMFELPISLKIPCGIAITHTGVPPTALNGGKVQILLVEV